jgi:K+-transporting ATPase ATPase C chain
MWTQLRIAFLSLLLLTLLTGVIYPLLVTAVGQGVFPEKANGSLIQRDGETVGSSLMGQHFSNPRYFWGRPSATFPVPYDGSASTGSNLGPSNPALMDAVKNRLAMLKAIDPENRAPVPIDLVTASGSGLDPHISLAAALWQVPRIARVRNLPEEKIRHLIDEYEEERALFLLGEPSVNVLNLNLALDRLHQEEKE